MEEASHLHLELDGADESMLILRINGPPRITNLKPITLMILSGLKMGRGILLLKETVLAMSFKNLLKINSKT